MNLKQKFLLLGLSIAIGLFIVIGTVYSSLSKLNDLYSEVSEIMLIRDMVSQESTEGLQIVAALRAVIINQSDEVAKKNVLSAIESFDKKIQALNTPKVQKVSQGWTKFEMEKNYGNFKASLDGLKLKIETSQYFSLEDNKNINQSWRPLKKSLQQWLNANQKKLDDYSKTYNEKIIFNEQIIIASLVILLLFVLGVIYYIAKNVLGSLESFQEGIMKFFQYLNKETNKANLIEIHSKDEFGVMGNLVNDNILKIEKMITQDSELIQDAQNVMKRVQHGWYSQHIEKSTSNQSLEEFKNGVNEMIKATKEHFINMNKILEEYAQYNYQKRLVLTDIEKGGVFEILVNDINILRDSITNMLVENKRSGIMLNTSAHDLLSNVVKLSQASNQAAASLEETAAAIEQMTSNIKNNTQSVEVMTQYAKALSQAADDGQDLATQTTTAMNEIDKEVNAINDAISVIDQIAFQTNILSLNAAVEAATAGESGKGFAVVAGEVRNLASRSAEAANEIKKLVQNATAKANYGKVISDKMIVGYHSLSENIVKTTEVIANVETASKEQQQGIEQINTAINILDRQTQENAIVASKAQDIANTTSAIASKIVSTTDEKEFDGKHDQDRRKKPIDTTYGGSEKREIEAKIKTGLVL